MTRMRRAVWALLAVDLGLLAWAVARGGQRVPDTGVFVTNGWLVAWGILATLVVVAVLPRVLPDRIATAAQALALGLQALHSLGHLAQLYYALPWYDDLLHVTAPVAIGVLATLLLRARDPDARRHLGALGLALVAFVTVLAFAGAWEIFEYGMDSAFGTHEQDDLADTMTDMIDGAIGGAIAGGWAYFAHSTRSLSLPTRSSSTADKSAR